MTTDQPSRVYFPSMALRKTRYLRQTVSSSGPSIFNQNSRRVSSENHKEYLAQLHSRKAVSLKEKKVKQQKSSEEGYASSSPSSASLVPSRPPIPRYHHVCEPSYGDEEDVILDECASITTSVDFIPGFVRRCATKNEEQMRKHRNFISHEPASTSSTEDSCHSFRWSFRSESKETRLDEQDEMVIGWTRRKTVFRKWKLNQTIQAIEENRQKMVCVS